jgi:4-aminobutyrate aminotransferase
VHHDLQGNARRVGGFLVEQLARQVAHFEVVAEVRGRGLMVGVELVEPATLTPSRDVARFVLEACRRQGLLIGTGGLNGNVLRIAPAMSVTMEEAAQAVEVLAAALACAETEFTGQGKR